MLYVMKIPTFCNSILVGKSGQALSKKSSAMSEKSLCVDGALKVSIFQKNIPEASIRLHTNSEGQPSTSAAIVSHENGFYMRRAFHLPSAMSIFSAELFAIYEALKYSKDTILQAPGIQE